MESFDLTFDSFVITHLLFSIQIILMQTSLIYSDENIVRYTTSSLGDMNLLRDVPSICRMVSALCRSEQTIPSMTLVHTVCNFKIWQPPEIRP